MGKSSSKSQANQTSITENTDKRIVNESGVVATEGSVVNATIERLDADIVESAISANRDGFSNLLDVVDRLTTKTQDSATAMAGRYTQDVLQGISQVGADKNGTIDQRTMIILGGGAMAALVAIQYAKRKG